MRTGGVAETGRARGWVLLPFGVLTEKVAGTGIKAGAAGRTDQGNGMPSSLASLSGSIMPPRDSIRSLMFNNTRVGSPSARTGAASMSWR